jgi:hypothetical protein
MDCCETARPVWGDLGSDHFFLTTLRSRSATVRAYLKALATPEPSDTTELVSELPPGRLFGAVKASLWAFVAVGLGVLLAMVCH